MKMYSKYGGMQVPGEIKYTQYRKKVLDVLRGINIFKEDMKKYWHHY